MADYSYEEYQQWVDLSSIQAPKVQMGTTKDMQRGLVATDTIYEGERIMCIPSSCLIGEDTLQQRGSSMLLNRDDNSDDLSSCNGETLELLVIGMIEEFRSLLLQEDSILYLAAHQVQYEWRGDDAVALFLIACQHILETRPEFAQGGEESTVNDSRLTWDESAANNMQDTKTSESETPPLVEATPDLTSEPVSVFVEDLTVQPLVVEGTEVEPPSNQEVLEASPSFLQHVIMLPKEFPHCPFYFSEEELTSIEGTNCHGFTTRMLQQMESDYAKLAQVLTVYNKIPNRKMRCTACQSDADESCWCHVLDPERIVQLESYKWALCNVYSRSTDFAWDTGSGQTSHRRVIAPLFDMMNHDFASDVTHSMDHEGNVCVFNGSTEIQPGDEILLNYGNFRNEKLLLVYGFCVPKNPHDAVQIYAPLSPSDPLFQVKARMLASRCGIEDVNAPHALIRQAGSAIIPSSLLAVLRLIGVQSPEEVMTIARQDEPGIGMISIDNEASALQALNQALHTMARQLALNMISDDGLHAASSVPRTSSYSDTNGNNDDDKASLRGINARNAKILCQSEYQILQAAMASLSERLARLQESMDGYQ